MPPRRSPTSYSFWLTTWAGGRDTSLYGSKYYETPNVDKLARHGMMFTQAYAAAPICSPTRASIMTGLYPARLGMTRPSGHVPQVVLQQRLVEKAGPGVKALQCNTVTWLKGEYFTLLHITSHYFTLLHITSHYFTLLHITSHYFTLAEALKDGGYATAHFGKWRLGAEPYDPLHQGFDVDMPHTSDGAPTGGYFAPWKFWPGQGVSR